MSILLVELETSGHHITSYLRSVVNYLSNKNKKIILLTSADIKKKDYYNFFKKKTKIIFTKKIEYPINKNYFNLLKFQFNYYENIKKSFEKIIKKNDIDHVYVNTIDFFDKPISILGSPFKEVKFSALYLNPKFYKNFSYLSQNFFKKNIYEALFRRLINIKSLDNLFFVDPLCYQYLKNQETKFKKICYVEDLGTGNIEKKIILKKKYCRKILNINEKDFIILVYGKIRLNKCLSELFAVLKYINNQNNIKILIAGEQDEMTKIYIKNKLKRSKYLRNRVIIINRYIPDKMEHIIFRASDLTWTGYSKDFYGSSGVFFLSCLNRIPVITSDHGVIGWYGKIFKVGKSVDLENKTKLIKTINAIFKKKIKYSFNEVNKKHNFINFGKKISRQLSKSL